jgi:hypothetical protein
MKGGEPPRECLRGPLCISSVVAEKELSAPQHRMNASPTVGQPALTRVGVSKGIG